MIILFSLTTAFAAFSGFCYAIDQLFPAFLFLCGVFCGASALAYKACLNEALKTIYPVNPSDEAKD